MADPVLRPLKWPKEYHVYAEQHGMFDVMMEVFRELTMWKPVDPLAYIQEEIPRIAKCIFAPRVFILGPYPAAEIGQNISDSTGAVYLTVEEIVESAPQDIRPQLAPILFDYEPNQCLCSLLIATINRRLAMSDCMKCGYVLYGFPRSKTEAMYAQQNGLVPRQIFILLPQGQEKSCKLSDKELTGGKPKALLTRQISIDRMQEKKNYCNLKDIGTSYSGDVSRVIPYERWSTTKQSHLEAEFLGTIIARKPSGAPYVPKIIVIGPCGAGKSIVADHIAEKFGLVKFDWMETVRGFVEIKENKTNKSLKTWTPLTVRGFAQLNDDTAMEAKLYLENLTPLSEEAVKTILSRKLEREDCQKKGWILEGFPENALQAKVMEDLSCTPNRIFLVSVPETISHKRKGARRHSIISRRVQGIPVNPNASLADEKNMRTNPHSEYAVQRRCEQFSANLDDIIAFYGNKIIYIDGTQTETIVKEFAETSVVRPPTLRF